MNTGLIRFQTLIVCLLLALPLSGPVGAAEPSSPEAAPVITFEESIPNPQVVRNQYCNNPATNKGVEFLGIGGHIFAPSAGTASPTHALTNVFPGEEFQMDRWTKISFTAPQSSVSVKVGLDRTYAFDVTARLMAFSTAVPVQSSMVDAKWLTLGKGPTPITTLLTVSRTQGDIRSVTVDYYGSGVGMYAFEVIDDLTYSLVGPPCVNDVTPPWVQISQPAVDDQTFFLPTTEIAFTAQDAESGIAQIKILYLDATNGEIESFSYCGGTIGVPCGSPYSPVTGHFTADLPKTTRTIRVQAIDFAGRPGHADRTVKLVLPSPNMNLWLQGMEITQATQSWVPQQTQSRSNADPPLVWIYPGPPSAVPLVAGRTTVVRVYASVEGTGVDIPLVGARARLHCYTDWMYMVPCPGGGTLTSTAQVTISPNTALSTKRGQANLSWNFVLPALWTWMTAVTPGQVASTIYLEAEVDAPAALPECTGCRDTANRMRVSKVQFTATESFWPRVNVLGYNWTVQGQTFKLDANDVKRNLDFIRKIYPVQETTVPANIWVGTYDDGKNLAYNNPGKDGERCDAMLDFAKGGYSSLGKYKRLALIVRQFPCAGVGSLSGGYAFANVGDEDTGAHELGHACGIQHAGPPPGHGAECGSGGSCDSDWPWPHGTLGHYGFDTMTMQAIIPGTTESDPHDVMSYGGPPYWISPRNWTRLFNVFASANAPYPLAADVQAESSSAYLWVRGALDASTGWNLLPAYELSLPSGSNDAVGEGDYAIELLNASGQPLFTRRFAPVASYIDGIEPATAIAAAPRFNEVLPLPAGATTIALQHGTQTLATRSRSARAPYVTLTSPTASGFTGQPDNPRVAWGGGDADSETVFYLVQYTRGPQGGRDAEWVTLAVDLTGEVLPVSLSGLAGSTQAMVRILASDGLNTTAATSPAFIVAGHPPGAQILSPQPEAVFMQGETTMLLAAASDAEDGLLDGAALSWYDNGRRLLGTGQRLDVSTLTPGSHTIMLIAHDSAGQMDTAVVPITVVARPNTQPVAVAGPDRTTGVNVPVTLYGAWSNDLDGDQLNFHWQVTGQPGESHAVLSDPSAILPTFTADQVGSYEVELVVDDGQVSSLPDRVSVIVGAAGTRVYLAPPESSVTISDTVTLDLRVEAIENLYAAQVELSFDPSLLAVVDAYDFVPGVQIEEGDFPVPDVSIINSANNTTGQIQYSVSLQGVKPGVNGSGTLARITFRGSRAGLSRIGLERVILSDPMSGQIAARVEDGVIQVKPALAAAVAGKVTLERRSTNTGVEATIGGRSATTTETGQYILYGVPIGAQTLTLRRPSYLATWRQVTVTAGQTLSLPDVTLLGGDVNADDRIGQYDAMGLAVAWNTAPGHAQWSPRADITDDQAVNVLDMTAVQYNWGKAAPGPWAGAIAAQAVTLRQGLPAPEATTRVVISPALTTLAAIGKTAEVQIRVQDVTRFYGGHVIVQFDPAVLRVRDADARPSAPGVQVRPGDFLDLVNRYELVNKADNVAGTIEYAVTQLYPAAARNGSGVLATIIFEGKAPGSSPAHISLVELGDDTWPDPQPIPAATQDGQVTVDARWATFLPLIMR